MERIVLLKSICGAGLYIRKRSFDIRKRLFRSSYDRDISGAHLLVDILRGSAALRHVCVELIENVRGLVERFPIDVEAVAILGDPPERGRVGFIA